MRRGHGFSLVESAVSVALLGIIVVAVLSAFSTLSLASQRHRVATNLDRLARSDAEYIKTQTYQPKPGVYTNLSVPGYTFSIKILYYDWFTNTFSTTNTDFGFQEIDLTVSGPGGATELLKFDKGTR